MRNLLNKNDRDAELIARAYYIRNSGQTCDYGGAKVPVPSLYRVGLKNNPINTADNGKPDTPEEIATGIEQLQVQYGVDTTGDLSVDQYLDADALNTDTTLPTGTRSLLPESGYSLAASARKRAIPIRIPTTWGT